MSADEVSNEIADFREQIVAELIARHIPEKAYAEQWDAAGLHTEVHDIFGVDLPIVDWTKEEGIADEEVRERIQKAVDSRAAERAANSGIDVMRYVEKAILLQTLDQNWREHIINLDHLRQYVGLRGYGQRDPLNEYKQEAFELFEALLVKLRTDVVRQLMHIQIQSGEQPPPLERAQIPMRAHHINPLTGEDDLEPAEEYDGVMRPVRAYTGPVDPNNPQTWGRVQRNAPCPCGSGRKFKHCHGALV
jgi:preprotein translocase subunit SecA